MRIGITCYPAQGGSGVVATELGKSLAQKGHKIHFITYSQPSRLDFFNENLFYHEVSINAYPLFEYPPYEVALAGKMADVALFEIVDAFEKRTILDRLEQTGWSQTEAALSFHVPLSTLNQKIKRHGIKSKKKKEKSPA